MRGDTGKVPEGNDFPSRKDIESSSKDSLNNKRYKNNA